MKIFVGGFTMKTKVEDLWALFGKVGKLKEVTIIKDKKTKLSKCYGFVTPHSLDTYNKILSQNFYLEGRLIDCHPGFKKKQNPNLFDQMCNKKIFVGGLNPRTEDEALKLYFSGFGDLHKAYVIRDPYSHESRRFGFVIMNTGEGVESVLEYKDHIIDNYIVTVKLFEKEEDYLQKEREKYSTKERAPRCKDKVRTKKSCNPLKGDEDVQQEINNLEPREKTIVRTTESEIVPSASNCLDQHDSKSRLVAKDSSSHDLPFINHLLQDPKKASFECLQQTSKTMPHSLHPSRSQIDHKANESASPKDLQKSRIRIVSDALAKTHASSHLVNLFPHSETFSLENLRFNISVAHAPWHYRRRVMAANTPYYT